MDSIDLRRLLKTNIILMKIEGLFVSESLDSKRLFRRNTRVKDLEKNEETITDTNKNNRNKKNILHILYCIFIYLILLYFMVINGFLSFYSPIYNEKVFGIESIKSEAASNETSSTSDFSQLIISIAVSIIYVQVALYPLFFLIATWLSSGFESSVKSFKHVENVIKGYFCSFNQRVASETKILHHSHKKWLFYWTFVYNIVAITIILGVTIYSLYNFFSNSFTDLPIQAIFINISVIFLYMFFIAVLFTTLYFVTTLILLSRHQFNSFEVYLIEAIKYFKMEFTQKEIKNEELPVFDVEIIRHFYNELCDSVQELDKWLRFFFGLIYFTAIPSFCLFLYAIVATKLSMSLIGSAAQIIILVAIELLLLTISSLALSVKAS